MPNKVCSKCKISKALDDFGIHGNGIDGYDASCKECHKARRQLRRKLLKEGKEVPPATRDALRLSVIENKVAPCSRCGITKELHEFAKKPTGFLGITFTCSLCIEKRRKQKFDTDESYRISERARLLKWKKDNPEKVQADYARRRASRLRAVPAWASDEFEELFVVEMYDLSRRRKECLGIDFHVDHIVPLISKLVCGLHCMANLQVLPASVNMSKGNKYWPDMP